MRGRVTLPVAYVDVMEAVRRRRAMLLGFASFLLAAAAVEACVGEDPPFAPAAPPDGGSNASSSSGATTSSSSSSSGAASSSSSGGPTDAGPDGLTPDAACDPSKRFGTPEPIALDSDESSVTSLRFSRGGFYFSGDLAAPADSGDVLGALDLYAVDFANKAFGTPRKLTALSASGVEDVSPTESSDGQLLFFASGDVSNRRLRRAVRSAVEVTLGLDYSTSTALTPPLVKPGSTRETDPYLVGSRLYFAADDGASGSNLLALFSVSIDAGGLAGNDLTKALPDIGVGSAETRSPVVGANETELFYSSFSTVGGVESLLHAMPADAPHTFKDPSIVFKTPPATHVAATELSRDACDLYISTRDPGGRFKILVAHRMR